MSEIERELAAKKLEDCYKALAITLAKTYGVPVPTVEFSWKFYTDFGPGATYKFKERKIYVTYDTRPDEFAHEFKHYLQEIVEGRDYESEVLKAYKEGKIWSFSMAWMLPIEEEAEKFGNIYGRVLEEAGRKVYGSQIWTLGVLRDSFRRGEVPEFVMEVFKRRIEVKELS